MSAKDVARVTRQLHTLRSGLVREIGDNAKDPRNSLITAMRTEERRLRKLDPEALTIFDEAAALSPGLHLINVSTECRRGTLAAEAIQGSLTNGSTVLH